jgi:hypothetical protein
MKKLCIVLCYVIAINLQGYASSKVAGRCDVADTTLTAYASSMLRLYRIVYRPPANETRQRIKDIKIKGRQLVITYLTCCSGKKVSSFYIDKIEPQYKVPAKESDTPEGRSFVIDTKTGKNIFLWLERKTDAAMLKADLNELKKHLLKNK